MFPFLVASSACLLMLPIFFQQCICLDIVVLFVLVLPRVRLMVAYCGALTGSSLVQGVD